MTRCTQVQRHVDLALFPQLKILRISILDFLAGVDTVALTTDSLILRTFPSICPTSRIYDIVLRIGTLDAAVCEQLDRALSRLPLLHQYTVTLQMGQSAYDERKPFFPRLTSSKMLRRIEPDLDWFKNLGSVLQ
ncbi:hypothetical protein C8R46DRAFT_1215047 [Mycena filopes]|nr:hypothetical protein C8R46DRAFT_1215047 [Mycena filopes]